jgi:competence protein ComEA
MRFLNRWWARLVLWPWLALVARGIGWCAAFAALAWIGAGAARRVEVVPEAIPMLPRGAASAFAVSAPAPVRRAPCGDASSADAEAVLPDGRVVLNRAGAAVLGKLPGIGDKRAQAIIALRERLGRFRSLRDLLRVRGIGPKMLQRLEPLCVLDPPAEPPASASDKERGGA